MLEDIFYRRESVVDIDAAVVGVSRLRWTALSPKEANDATCAREVMTRHQFDVLPIDPGSGPVREYIKTRTWGDYSAVERCDIEYDEVLPQQTPLYAVIRALAEKNRHHLFLTHEGNVTGLITVVNLNCRQARILLFGLLSDLEVRMGRLVQAQVGRAVSEDEVLAMASDAVRPQYEADRQQNIERDVVEYLYLPDLLKLLQKLGLYERLGYGSKAERAQFDKLVKLRNAVAHPGRTIIEDVEGVQKLWRDIQVIERALFRIKRWQEDHGSSVAEKPTLPA
ncbi:MAG: hypothetical protein WD009_14165 [Phycisphaeraceae bacterium]